MGGIHRVGALRLNPWPAGDLPALLKQLFVATMLIAAMEGSAARARRRLDCLPGNQLFDDELGTFPSVCIVVCLSTTNERACTKYLTPWLHDVTGV